MCIALEILAGVVGSNDVEFYTPLFGNKLINPTRKALFTVDIGYIF
jgi:hypothetical protein